MRTVTLILINVFIAIVIISIFACIYYIRKMSWIGDKEAEYIDKAKAEITHSTHRQRVFLWIQSKKAEDLYTKSPKNFPTMYKNKVDEIGENLIKELREKYENEYKSRNTKDVKTV